MRFLLLAAAVMLIRDPTGKWVGDPLHIPENWHGAGTLVPRYCALCRDLKFDQEPPRQSCGEHRQAAGAFAEVITRGKRLPTAGI